MFTTVKNNSWQLPQHISTFRHFLSLASATLICLTLLEVHEVLRNKKSLCISFGKLKKNFDKNSIMPYTTQHTSRHLQWQSHGVPGRGTTCYETEELSYKACMQARNQTYPKGVLIPLPFPFTLSLPPLPPSLHIPSPSIPSSPLPSLPFRSRPLKSS